MLKEFREFALKGNVVDLRREATGFGLGSSARWYEAIEATPALHKARRERRHCCRLNSKFDSNSQQVRSIARKHEKDVACKGLHDNQSRTEWSPRQADGTKTSSATPRCRELRGSAEEQCHQPQRFRL